MNSSICTGSLDKPSHEWDTQVKCAACAHWLSRSSRVNGPVKHWDNGLTFQWWRRRIKQKPNTETSAPNGARR